MLEQTSLMPRGTAPSHEIFDHSTTLAKRYEKPLSLRRSSVVQDVTFERSPEEELPRSAMSLKEATALYGMHLTFGVRDRIFGELNFLLDPTGWDVDDALPSKNSYLSFLKWAVETKRHDWVSLSLDGDGNIVAVFLNGKNQITAAFLPEAVVNWTSRISTEDGIDVSAGRSPLRTFAATSEGLLARL